MTEPDSVRRVAEALAKDATDEFIAMTGHGTPWEELSTLKRERAIKSQEHYAQIAITALELTS